MKYSLWFALIFLALSVASCADDSPAEEGAGQPDQSAEPSPDMAPEATPDANPAVAPEPDPEQSCGDGVCSEGEDFTSCPDDCSAPDPCGDGVCDEGEDFQSCPEDCEEPAECQADETECRAEVAFVCEEGRWVEGECPENHECIGSDCVEIVCAANTARCIDEVQLGICNSQGTEEEIYSCPEPSFCEDALCQSGCVPGERSCRGDEVVECDEDARTLTVVEECSSSEGTVCQEGDCVSNCDAFDSKGGYIGCDYWGVDTPNSFGLRNVFAFVISNVDDNSTAHVIVEDRDGELILEEDVGPQQVATLRMPLPREMNVGDSGITNLGLRITTDVPINAYQFNPLQRFDNNMGVSVASNDASLMIPDSALGTEYIGAAFTQWSRYSSFLSIVSTEDENIVRITPSTTVQGGEGVPQIPAGEEVSFTLERGQVLTLKSASAGGDLTGTIISTDFNVAVYGGVDCAQVPVGATYCDHIEEKLFPVQAWDVEYFATKFSTRGIESDIWRIVASEDQTTIVTEPNQLNIPVLNRGEFFEFTSTEDFKITATSPVMVAQYMTGSSTTNSRDDGDPSMLLSVPARQFRRDYVFLVPDTYGEDWMTMIFPDGAAPVLDGVPIDLGAATPIGATGFNVLRQVVPDGRHEVISDLPVGVSIYGYDHNISYAYPAGLDLSAFNGDDD